VAIPVVGNVASATSAIARAGIALNHGLTSPAASLKDALSEVKNANYLSSTQQIRDYTQYALDNGIRFDLYVRPGATLSGPLLNAESKGLLNILEIPF
jgi:hypothetical protein